MNKREKRVINAFIDCVKNGEYTFEYACILIEDTSKYGWLTEDAKEIFYVEFETEKTTEEEVQATENTADDEEKVENVDNSEISVETDETEVV